MTGGTALSERERERQAAAGPLAGPVASAGAGARERAVRWAGPRGKRRIGPFSFLFFFFK
jgi:hypothetical protein